MPNTNALIIDDDPNSLEVLGRLLRSQGVNYQAVQDGSVFTGGADLAGYDVIFLDLEMPYVSGYELFEIFKTQHGFTAPIIACSVHSNEMETVRELGFQGFVGKPIIPELFADQLQRILDNQPVWDN